MQVYDKLYICIEAHLMLVAGKCTSQPHQLSPVRNLRLYLLQVSLNVSLFVLSYSMVSCNSKLIA